MKPARETASVQPPGSISKGVKLVLVPLAISLLAVGLALQIELVESALVRQIVPALADFGVRPGMLGDFGWLAKLLEFIAILGTSVGAVYATDRITNQQNLIPVAVPIFAVSALVQIALLIAVNASPLFVSTAVTVVLSLAGGVILKRTDERNKVLQRNYYEAFIRNQELVKARAALVKQDEVERRLLAADLHDQVLNDLKKILEAFSKFENDPEDKAASGLIRAGFNKTMNDIREIMDDLCPIMLQNFGLRAAVEDCLEKGKERSGYKADFDCDIDDDVLDRLSQVEQSLLYRLIQESLTNISKHAQASKVELTLRKNGHNLVFAIEDNGKGIDYETVSHQSRGLRYMKLRADLIDATVEWKPGRDSKGTKVVITYPLVQNRSSES